jgi:branched-chain amino acid aminotransferase
MADRVMWFNGACVAWEEARVHVWDEVALRGANVFEGVTAFWDAERAAHRLLAGRAHLDRLFASARTADIPAPSRQEVATALAEVAAALPGTDVYLRPTLYASRGRTALAPDSVGGMYVGGFEYNPVAPALSRAVVSSHRRFGGPIPASAKSGGTYLDFRVFERERIAHGVEHVLFLNEHGHAAEADGAAILLMDGRSVMTPSPESGVLDSITKQIVLELASARGMTVTERPVLREELHSSQVVLAGTLLGLRALDSLDGIAQGNEGGRAAAKDLAADYAALCRGGHPLSELLLTPMTGPDGDA